MISCKMNIGCLPAGGADEEAAGEVKGFTPRV